MINKRYAYRVLTSATAGNSAFSNEANVTIANSAPEFIITHEQMPTAGTYNFTIQAVDPDGDNISFMFGDGSTSSHGLTISNNSDHKSATVSGTLSGVTFNVYPADYLMSFKARDGTASSTEEIGLLVPDPGGYTPPTISTSFSDQTIDSDHLDLSVSTPKPAATRA